MQSGLSCLQFEISNVYSYLEVLNTHTVIPVLIPLSDLRDIWRGAKEKSMSAHLHMPMPGDLDVNSWSY